MHARIQRALRLLLPALLASPVQGVLADVQVDLDPFGLVATASEADNAHVAGTLAFATGGSRREWALPFAFLGIDHGSAECCSYEVRRIDLQYRRFRDADRDGPYAGLTARFSAVEGADRRTGAPRDFTRAGLGIVVGFRLQVPRVEGLYVGANVNVGRFLDGEEPVADGAVGAEIFGPSDNGADTFFNVELAKIGYRFR